MTKPRTPFTEEAALHHALGILDEDEVREATGKSVSLFRQCANPDVDTHNLQFRDARRLGAFLVAHGQDEKFTAALEAGIAEEAKRYGGCREHVIGDALDRVCSTAKEAAEAMDAYRAVRNGDVSFAALNDARKEIAEMIEAGQLLMADLDALADGKVAQIGGR